MLWRQFCFFAGIFAGDKKTQTGEYDRREREKKRERERDRERRFEIFALQREFILLSANNQSDKYHTFFLVLLYLPVFTLHIHYFEAPYCIVLFLRKGV